MAEQRNSVLSKMEHQSNEANHFMYIVRLFVYIWNCRKAQKLDAIKQHLYELETE